MIIFRLLDPKIRIGWLAELYRNADVNADFVLNN